MHTYLEEPGFSVRSAAKHLGVNRDWVYKLIKDKRIRAELDACNQLLIPYGELYSALKQQDEQ